ncbi:hypothetical protein JYA63_17375 [Fictibacillus nanhaiensis]|uniref:XRE family transcriptional regulator n=1 Tax=Fictibacillus nanhaiensis TaxID=742169 RepID=A0ABS2ZT57_9BACL|nr:hypothetical protein [Fictibacillus nanhaiensis]
MNNYSKHTILELLDPVTIKAVTALYQLRLKHIGYRLNCTPQAVKYNLDNDSFKQWQKEKILDLFMDHGIEVAELILINSMAIKKGKNYEIH